MEKRIKFYFQMLYWRIFDRDQYKWFSEFRDWLKSEIAK